MNKNVLVIGLALLVVISLGYSFQQRKIETVATAKSLKIEKIASEQRMRAEEFQKMAELAREEALIQRTICEEQLKDCKSK